MKIIVFGASGYIGNPVANALARNGHIVIGQTRDAKNEATFKANEIIPLIASPEDVASWSKYLIDADIVIDCLGARGPDVGSNLLSAVVAEAKKGRSEGMNKLVYIYTSGTWIYGDDRRNLKTDSSYLPNTPALVAWRPQFERGLLESNDVRGIVIRPSLFYGRGAGLLGQLFEQGSNGSIDWHGIPGGRYATIHVDDLAELFVLTAEKNHLVSGQAFIATNPGTESVDAILYQFAELVGIPKEKVSYHPPANAYEEAFAGTTILRPTVARAILGWVPKKASLYDGLSTYYEAWKAQKA